MISRERRYIAGTVLRYKLRTLKDEFTVDIYSIIIYIVSSSIDYNKERNI